MLHSSVAMNGIARFSFIRSLVRWLLFIPSHFFFVSLSLAFYVCDVIRLWFIVSEYMNAKWMPEREHHTLWYTRKCLDVISKAHKITKTVHIKTERWKSDNDDGDDKEKERERKKQKYTYGNCRKWSINRHTKTHFLSVLCRCLRHLRCRSSSVDISHLSAHVQLERYLSCSLVCVCNVMLCESRNEFKCK